MKGFGTLKSPADLLDKLENDLDVFRKAPADVYAAFNFFVTAEHMLDWLYPGDHGSSGAAARNAEREEVTLLQIVSNLANGAKHFQPARRRHQSVKHVDSTPYGAGPYGEGPYGGQVMVSLDGEAAEQYGSSPAALTLAEQVLAYWRSHPMLA